MKKITLCILACFFTLLIGCSDNIPRGRETLALDPSLIASGEVEEDIEEEDDSITQRPSGAVIIEANACACQNGAPISIGNCASVCNSKQQASDNNRTLFFEVDLTEAITLDIYQDLSGWCATLPEEEFTNSCDIEIKDEGGTTGFVPFEPNVGQQNFAVNIETLGIGEDETYRLTIVENASGARSTTIQLRIISELIDDTIGGPLALMPVNAYTCIFREGFFDDATGELIIEDVNRFHFYFIPETRPEPLLPNTVPVVNCYDIELFGNTPVNSPLLEEKTGAFTVWNRDDPRFFDLSGTGTLRVHELIEQNVELQGVTLGSTPELFFPISWPNGFNDGDNNPGDETSSVQITQTTGQLGYFMTPFVDDTTFKSYCPTRLHYYSENPLFRAMREIVGVDTEALYVAKQNNVCDFLLIKESQLKQIWFFIEGGQHIEPTNDTVQGKQVQFYWPPSYDSPFIKKSHQRVYTVKGADELTCSSTTIEDGTQNDGGVRTSIDPHDNRIGCIPVLND